jgi:hypothetical protein
MRESCKSSGASKARGSGAGEISTGVGRHEGDDETDRRGPCGGDRGKKAAGSGRREPKRKTFSIKYAKGTCGPSG